MNRSNQLLHAIKELLLQEQMHTHEEIAHILRKQGYVINQSTVSRLLRKIGAVKGLNVHQQQVYLLPKETLKISTDLALDKLVHGISHNEQLIIIHTAPGSANVIAHLLDMHREHCHILGTIAGDDTILVVPYKIASLDSTIKKIEKLLYTKSNR